MIQFKLSDLEKVGPATEKKLLKAGIRTPLDIVIRGAKEFSRVSELSIEMAEKHVISSKKLMMEEENLPDVKSIATLRELRAKQLKIPLNVEELDLMLKGGIETQSLYEIYGPEGCGKTQFAITLAAEANRNGIGVMFIDCEGTFDMDRYDEICKCRDIESDEDILGYKMISDPIELLTELRNIAAEIAEKNIKVIIIDGLVGLMRLNYEGRGELYERQNDLETAIKYLRNISVVLNCAVVITNQIVSNPDAWGPKDKPIGGHVLGHYVKYIISIKMGLKTNRIARLVKAPNSPMADFSFYLNEEGVSNVEKLGKKKDAREQEQSV